MIDRDKVLPIAHAINVVEPSAYASGYAVGMVVQRDADLLILERDYVPKSRLAKCLMLLRQHNFAAADDMAAEFFESWEELEALAQLGEEVKG